MLAPAWSSEHSAGGAELVPSHKGAITAGLITHAGSPVIRYPQGKADTCVFSSAASALEYYGDQFGATKLAGNIDQSSKHLDPMALLHDIIDSSVVGWHCQGLRPLSTYNILEVHPLPTTVKLEGSDGSVNHAITIVAGYIFDSNESHALPLTIESLDRCVGARFVGCLKAIRLIPTQKLLAKLSKKRKLE